MKKNSIALLLASATFAVLSFSAHADGMPEEAPIRRKRVQPPPAVYTPAPVAAEPVQPVAQPPAPAPVAADEDCCDEFMARLAGGVTVWNFDEESTLPGPHLSAEVWNKCYPVALRVGVEGRHMYAGQEAAEFAREWDDKTTRITFIRIPFSLEYRHALAQDLDGFIGAGPDIIRTANDISDTNVGMHISARLHYAFDKNFGASLEAGYMWGDVDGPGKDVELNNAFITPALTYTF